MNASEFESKQPIPIGSLEYVDSATRLHLAQSDRDIRFADMSRSRSEPMLRLNAINAGKRPRTLEPGH